MKNMALNPKQIYAIDILKKKTPKYILHNTTMNPL